MRTKLTLAIVSALLLIGLAERKVMAAPGDLADAWGWTTTQSTGVLVSSNTPIILKSVTISTLTSAGEYVVIVDSNPLATASTGAAGGFPNVTIYPRSQWVTPQLVFVDTNTGRGTDWVGSEYHPWGDQGVVIKNGLIVYQSAVGGTVTVVWRKGRR